MGVMVDIMEMHASDNKAEEQRIKSADDSCFTGLLQTNN